MKLINNHKDIVEILNKNKDKIQGFELINDEFFLIRFTDETRVEIVAEDDCGVLATYVEV